MNNIYITGVNGFVGTNLKKYLDSKYNCIGISRKKTVENNIFSYDDFLPNLKGDAIIHLAGKAHDTASTSSPEEYFNVNRDLTINIFKTFLESDIKDFFYFSSVKAVADTVTGVLKEDVTGEPHTPYGKSKHEAEQYLLSQVLPKGKRLFIIRPCMIHGPGNKGNLNLLYKVVEKGVPWPLAVFENQRSFLSIDNLCFLVNSLLENKGVKSGVYNFSDDETLSTNKLIYLMSQSLGRKPKLWRLNKGLIVKIACIGDRLKLPLNSERLKKLTESYVVSNDKIKFALGLEKLPVAAEEGLSVTLSSFRK
ncbi:NAD-dependent epimerase/dehydratase family protein [Flavobacterium beibuense]|uniref:NAD-dependent epimerase/dehydratase n=1 Tax=Flavobacterium beibuense TaxID=657326 RepID=A0A444WIH2_9FLAO|nr:NAD-dependent epimerase/dehydratase family protein [Flavobacterium beibuense]RYJ45595.1 NAD-dependent epimerase/dehydratase [Flavobacterium beibuense]